MVRPIKKQEVCDICGLVLNERLMQLRADDEAQTLVRWCLVHEAQFNMLRNYRLCRTNPVCEDLTKVDFSRKVFECGDMKDMITRKQASHPSQWVECRIQIDGRDLDIASEEGCVMCNLIGKHCENTRDWSSHQRSSLLNATGMEMARYLSKQVLKKWNKRDKTNRHVPYVCWDSVVSQVFVESDPLVVVPKPTPMMTSQSRAMMSYCLSTNRDYNSLWVPKEYSFGNYRIDWEVSPLGTEAILCMPETICKHTIGTNVVSQVSKNLMEKRKIYKGQMKLLHGSDVEEHKQRYTVLYNLQLALKIAANSLYGCLAFRDYNTYSPRCGMSITAGGRWALHVSIAVAEQLGCLVIYGDTDSVMFTIPRLSTGDQQGTCLLPAYVRQLEEEYIHYDRKDCLEYMSGSERYNDIRTGHFRNMSGCITGIINNIMSFTCTNLLRLESQETGVETTDGRDTFVFERMMVLASKHYVARDMNGEFYSKGVSYVRRTGSVVQNTAARAFGSIILSTSSLKDAVQCLRVEYAKIVSQIKSQRDLNLYRVRATRSAVTGDYVKVIPVGSRELAARYAEFGSYEDEELDLEYYIQAVDSCLRSICRCIGLPDEGFVKNYSI